MLKSVILLFSLLPRWELLLDQPTCLGNDNETHYTRNSCNIDICNWKESKTVIIFIKCDNDSKLVCEAYTNGEKEECSKYENTIKF